MKYSTLLEEEPPMIAIDTDVLAIHHIFVRDKKRKENEEVFRKFKGKLVTSIHNLLELLVSLLLQE